jgi:hypothetical protein
MEMLTLSPMTRLNGEIPMLMASETMQVETIPMTAQVKQAILGWTDMVALTWMVMVGPMVETLCL